MGFPKTRLAGGTSLALQIGHRKSVDIDLFGQMNEDQYTITRKLDWNKIKTTIKHHLKDYLEKTSRH